MFEHIRRLFQSQKPIVEGEDRPAGEAVIRVDEPAEETRPRPRRLRGRQHKREFIVIGLGRFGTSVARTLVEQGHDVLAADVDYKRVQALASELPHVVQLDATNLDALREIGADSFDTGIVCISTDFEANLLATVLLRKLGVRRVIVKARTRTQCEILSRIGADEVILPEHEAGVRLARRLSAADFVDYLEVSPEISIIEMVAPSHLHGKTLVEADLRRKYGLTVIAIRRGEQLQVNPPADAVIEEGNELLVVGRLEDAERLSD
ncbi:potassium channel family protein [Ardenticatena maritima]|uniref:potassium channel family protein n=3 Tax=Ardenticatena maritima TaxID=872965 RepID=UPI0009EC2ABC|nr:TrkA family potassium uptake protein [Ardenticatena maritima]